VAKYGITPNGFGKKPFEVIVEELEADYVNIFGQSINLAAESPQGQMIARIAERIYDAWEVAESVYASYNIDDVSGKLLDNRAELRGDTRLTSESDEDFRIRIKEQLPNNVFKLKDELHENLLRVDGVTDVAVTYRRGITCAFVVGGDNIKVAETILDYMPPGALGGNVSIPVNGRCAGVEFFRPEFLFVKVVLTVSNFANLECECKSIDAELIATTIKENACSVGYGEFLYANYIRNIVSTFKGLQVDNIALYKATVLHSAKECNSSITYEDVAVDVVETLEHERVVICNVEVVVD